MKLFLASEIKHPETIERAKEFVGGFKDKKIVYIPTAANAEEGFGSWKQGGSWNLAKTLGADVTIVELESTTDEEVKNLLEGADILWMAGGMCGYLMYWIGRRSIDGYLKNLLDNGLYYLGPSAGSMIMGTTMDVSEWFPGEEERGSSIFSTLSIVDFDIFPHYTEELHRLIEEKFKTQYAGGPLYILKNGEEIVIDGDKMVLNGEERILSKN